MSQTVLAIECSSELCSVSLLFKDKISSKQKLAPREHAYLVLPFASELLKESGLEFSNLNGIAFGQGPGAFTGLRVAASMAQGLALAYDLPLYAECSLSALALQVYDMQVNESLPIGEPFYVVSILDARMSELYWSVSRVEQESLTQIYPPSLTSAESLITSLSDALVTPAYFVGPGCRHLIGLLNETHCINIDNLERDSEYFPHSRDIIKLIKKNGLQGNNDSSDHAASILPMPVYLRNNVAAKPKQLG